MVIILYKLILHFMTSFTEGQIRKVLGSEVDKVNFFTGV